MIKLLLRVETVVAAATCACGRHGPARTIRQLDRAARHSQGTSGHCKRAKGIAAAKDRLRWKDIILGQAPKLRHTEPMDIERWENSTQAELRGSRIYRPGRHSRKPL